MLRIRDTIFKPVRDNLFNQPNIAMRTIYHNVRDEYNQIKSTAMSYKYYVYVCPGHIKYFDDLQEAQEYARYYDAEVKEC